MKPSATRFFVITLGVAFGIGLPVAASARGLIPIYLPQPLMLLAVYSPAIAAIALARAGARAGLGGLLGPLLVWRLPIRWYAAALLLPFVVNAVALGLFAWGGGELPRIPGDLPAELRGLGATSALLYLNLTAFQLLGSLGEELGWRGYALPRLQLRHSALGASLMIGIVWTAWHVPLLLMPATTQAQVPLAWYVVYVPAISILFTWLYNHTQGSLLPVILLHAAIQAANIYLPIIEPVGLYALSVMVTVALAAGVVATCGARNLSRGARVVIPSADI